MHRHLGTLLAGACSLCCIRAHWGDLLRATSVTLSNPSQLIQRQLLQINHSEQENLIET